MTKTGNIAAIASHKHLTVLCVILAAVAASGWLSLRAAHGQAPSPAAPGPWLYPALIGAEAALLAYVARGLRAYGTPLVRLLDDPARPRRWLGDAALGLALFALLYLAGHGLDAVFGHGDATLVKPLTAAATARPLTWIVLAVAAGICEELTYRGYLQAQLAALTRRPWLGLAAQAAVFGVTHGYQGPLAMLKITILGAIFGAVALAWGSRAPGIVAHALLDIVGGLGLPRFA